jgi:hypothetical protein
VKGRSPRPSWTTGTCGARRTARSSAPARPRSRRGVGARPDVSDKQVPSTRCFMTPMKLSGGTLPPRWGGGGAPALPFSLGLRKNPHGSVHRVARLAAVQCRWRALSASRRGARLGSTTRPSLARSPCGVGAPCCSAGRTAPNDYLSSRAHYINRGHVRTPQDGHGGLVDGVSRVAYAGAACVGFTR